MSTKHIEMNGRECLVYFSEIDGRPHMVQRKVDVRRSGGTGFGWRNLPLASPMAKRAIALARATDGLQKAIEMESLELVPATVRSME